MGLCENMRIFEVDLLVMRMKKKNNIEIEKGRGKGKKYPVER